MQDSYDLYCANCLGSATMHYANEGHRQVGDPSRVDCPRCGVRLAVAVARTMTESVAKRTEFRRPAETDMARMTRGIDERGAGLTRSDVAALCNAISERTGAIRRQIRHALESQKRLLIGPYCVWFEPRISVRRRRVWYVHLAVSDITPPGIERRYVITDSARWAADLERAESTRRDPPVAPPAPPELELEPHHAAT